MTLDLSSGEFEEASLEYALKAINVATNPTNYKILQKLPNSSEKLKHELNLTVMPYYRRLNQLYSVGLIEWNKGISYENNLKLTPFGATVLDAVSEFNVYFIKQLNGNFENVLKNIILENIFLSAAKNKPLQKI